MREAQTASELMLENQLAALSKSEPGMVLPSRDVQELNHGKPNLLERCCGWH